MTFQALMFRLGAGINDRKRNNATEHPKGVVFHKDIAYSGFGKYSLLNVYYPEGAEGPLPTIVSIHGGGYVYGSKEVYHHYCADLARRGFAVVNFNYRLAPKWKFPAPLEDTNKVMQWLIARAKQYHMDPERIFIVGDSAGAQLASQYAAIWANPGYAAHFFKVQPVKILALGLNCGMYDVQELVKSGEKGLQNDYLPKDKNPDDPRFNVAGAIGPNYPPAHITTACHDFLRANAEPMCAFLNGKGIEAQWKCYGTEAQQHIGHVFHVDIRNPEATVCNDEQCAFFRKFL